MSDNPKDDDWGMTLPNVPLNEEKKKDVPPNFPPKAVESTPSLPPADDWGMTTPNINIPNNAASPPPSQAPGQPIADFDSTTPNINIPQQFSEQPKQSPASNQPSDDWGISSEKINVPKENKKDDWQMPTPVFRKSEGEKPTFDKTTPNFNLKNLNEDFGSPYNEEDAGNKTTPYYRLPENQGESNAAPPEVSEQSADGSQKKSAVKQKSGNAKWFLLLGGLFAFFLIATAALVAAYFLYFNTPNTVKSVANKSTETAPTAAPTVAVTNTLPASVNYKGDMVLVAAGEFTMGSDTGGDESKPAHKVTVPAFYIDKTEVTNAQYKEFCTANGKSAPPDPFWEKGYFENRPNAPVLGVSFNDAQEFAKWAGKRLPTEAEWEKAASWDAAKQSKLDFPWGASFENGKAAFGLDTPKDVGSFPSGASPSGAMDMAGNVAEWVDAFFQPYPNNVASNPNFGETNRVVRGGHFGSKSNDLLKTTKRIYVPPGVASGEDEEKLFAAAIGFRCAVSADDARLQESLKK
ncbi:MAG TPA: SUMF1/EgtB/PvdO family nonheme iron enzyme [Pyrinomonadaceae bacterium]|nr:SUMF1/EgtB/PvdO family nonheme iron enzyme [Pyrinomonadaceae bacterium]